MDIKRVYWTPVLLCMAMFAVMSSFSVSVIAASDSAKSTVFSPLDSIARKTTVIVGGEDAKSSKKATKQTKASSKQPLANKQKPSASKKPSTSKQKPSVNAPLNTELSSAVQWYQELAEDGNADAQYNLGNIYETGFGIKQDNKKAVKWYTRAAKQGNAQAQLRLGMLIILGKGATQSDMRGAKWFREAAEKDIEIAKLLSEKIFSHDIVLPLDTKKIVRKVFKTLDNNGEAAAKKLLLSSISKAQQQKKDKTKKQRFRGDVTGSAAKPGTVKNKMPDFVDGKISPPTALISDSLTVIQQQAASGFWLAQYELARMYDVGRKVGRDKKKAFGWYLEAAQQDHRESKYRVAIAYMYGLGVERSIIQASTWLKAAMKQKHPAAILLNEHLQAGSEEGLNFDQSIVLSWFIEKSLTGDGIALYGLGHMYENGWGVKSNPEEAKVWYTKARAAGFDSAARQLRRMKGDEVINDIPESEKPLSIQDTRPIETRQNVAANTQAKKRTVQTAMESQAGQDRASAESQKVSQAKDRMKATLREYSDIIFYIIIGVAFWWFFLRNSKRKNNKIRPNFDPQQEGFPQPGSGHQGLNSPPPEIVHKSLQGE